MKALWFPWGGKKSLKNKVLPVICPDSSREQFKRENEKGGFLFLNLPCHPLNFCCSRTWDLLTSHWHQLCAGPGPFKVASFLKATGYPHSCPTPSSHPKTTWPGVWYNAWGNKSSPRLPKEAPTPRDTEPWLHPVPIIGSFRQGAQEWRSWLPSLQSPSGHCCCVPRGYRAELARRQVQAGLGGW